MRCEFFLAKDVTGALPRTRSKSIAVRSCAPPHFLLTPQMMKVWPQERNTCCDVVVPYGAEQLPWNQDKIRLVSLAPGLDLVAVRAKLQAQWKNSMTVWCMLVHLSERSWTERSAFVASDIVLSYSPWCANGGLSYLCSQFLTKCKRKWYRLFLSILTQF